MAENTRNHVTFLGGELVPNSGLLIVPNALSFEDLTHLERGLAGRRVAYLIHESSVFEATLQAHFEQEGVHALEFATREEHLPLFREQIAQLTTEGQILVYVPGKSTVRAGTLTTVPRAILSYLLRGGVPVLPLYIDHPSEGRLKIERQPKEPSFVFSFGALLQPEQSTLPAYQEDLYRASQPAFERRPVLRANLAYCILQGMKKHGAAARVINGEDGSSHGFDKLLAMAIELSQVIRSQTTQPRVGILLPPSFAGLIANVATLFAGKVPVNLNFTASESAALSAMQQASLDLFITVDAFVRKTQRFPWPPTRQIIFLERLLPTRKKQIVAWLIASKLLPVPLLAKILGVSRTGGEREAVLLFTSGSSGDPKGVVLTHRNLISNVNQFSSRLQMQPQDSALACLPLFHSFGCTVTMWYPLIEGISLVTHPNPVESKKLASFIEKYRISLVVATPTFLRGYLKHAAAEQFQAVKLVITGAEKLPPSLAEQFEQRFSKPVLEGYGLTETSPVTNVNLPDPVSSDPRLPSIPSHRPGSVGQFIPGMSVRITDPATGAALPLNESGMIWLSGPNIFKEYLHQPAKSAEVLKDGWFCTGDLGRVDEDGFLYIEGRLTRFSKIGGEMVPHETVEEAVAASLGLATDEERHFAIVGLPDEAKGESLILLSILPALDPTDLRYRLLERGLPSLWIPRQIVKVPEIPHLASGKLDLKRCQELARQA